MKRREVNRISRLVAWLVLLLLALPAAALLVASFLIWLFGGL